MRQSYVMLRRRTEKNYIIIFITKGNIFLSFDEGTMLFWLTPDGNEIR